MHCEKITDMDLYSMPSVSDNHHLKLSLHLTNCESSVTKQCKEFQKINLTNFKFTEISLPVVSKKEEEMGSN